MAERQSEHPLDEGLYVLSFWTLVWGPVFAAELLHANKAFMLVTVGCWIAIFTLEKQMGPVLLRYRTIMVALAAFFAGYCWYAYLEQNSEESKTRVAALQACAEFPSCIESARLHGLDTGGYIDIFPAPARPPRTPAQPAAVDTPEKALLAIGKLPASPRLEDLPKIGFSPDVIQMITDQAKGLDITPQQLLDGIHQKAPGKQGDLGQP